MEEQNDVANKSKSENFKLICSKKASYKSIENPKMTFIQDGNYDFFTSKIVLIINFIAKFRFQNAFFFLRLRSVVDADRVWSSVNFRLKFFFSFASFRSSLSVSFLLFRILPYLSIESFFHSIIIWLNHWHLHLLSSVHTAHVFVFAHIIQADFFPWDWLHFSFFECFIHRLRRMWWIAIPFVLLTCLRLYLLD